MPVKMLDQHVYTWEHDDAGWWVVEYAGMLRTGPFVTQTAGVEWYRRELDKVIEEDSDDKLER